MAQIWRKQTDAGVNIFDQVNGPGIVTSPTIGTITPTSNSATFTHSGGTTHYRNFLLGDTPGAWVVIPTSPVLISGLSTNTEYTLQLSGDGSTVDDTRNWGTLNPGSGSGGLAFTPTLVALAPTNVSLTTFRPRYQINY